MISMAQCYAAVTPLLKHWSQRTLPLSHKNFPAFKAMIYQFVDLLHDESLGINCTGSDK